MGRAIDINGIAIALDNIAHIDRIRRLRGDSAVAMVTYGLRPGQQIYEMKIHFLGDTKPLSLYDKSEKKMIETRAKIVDAI